MKVIELLLQGKKAWDINKNGYYWLDKDDMMYTNINTKKTEHIMTINFLFREGKEYIESKNIKYFWSFKGCLFELYREPSFTIGCNDVKGCNDRICMHCPLYDRDGRVGTNEGEIYKIEY